MKTHRIPTVRRPGAPAFTLIELMVVVSIIGILAALSIGAFTMATQTAARNRTQATLQAIISALEVYKKDNGDYPKPKDATSNHGLDVKTGAQMLYQAITGDGNNEIDLGSSTETGKNSQGPRGVNPKFQINGDFVPNQKTDGTWSPGKLNSTLVSSANEFYLIDGFGHPFQYDKAQPTSGNPPPTPTTVNPTYDLWSYGNTNSTESTDASLGTKGNATATSIWIKNW